MTNEIMELVHHAIYAEESYVLSECMDKIQESLEAQHDYTRAVTSERDELRMEIEDLKSGLANYREIHADRDSLRKAAQMALEAYDYECPESEYEAAFEGLRKELGE